MSEIFKIGFILIDQTYAVYHAMSLAIELSLSKTAEITILCTKRNRKVVQKILDNNQSHHVKVATLKPYWNVTLPHYVEIKMQLRSVLFHRYRRLIGSFDALICTLYNDLLIKNYVGNHEIIKLIYTSHGVSNRPYSYSKKIIEFDFTLLAGRIEAKRNLNQKLLKPNNHAVIGYLKHDLSRHILKEKYFNNDRKTVIYNPHWTPTSSSYYKFGIAILDFFANSTEYNLIFSPHTLLFTRGWTIEKRIKKYKKNSHIIIDSKSERNNDMSFIKSADLYLGDVSSQALEFILVKPRPCLFIDAHQIREEDHSRITSWSMGTVTNHINQLGSQLSDAFKKHSEHYNKIQSQNIQEIFEPVKPSAAYHASKAIIQFLSRDQSNNEISK